MCTIDTRTSESVGDTVSPRMDLGNFPLLWMERMMTSDVRGVNIRHDSYIPMYRHAIRSI